MSDIEHEIIIDLGEARVEADEMRRLARRALVAASIAQEAAYGRHDAWIDAALRDSAPPWRTSRQAAQAAQS